MTESMMAPLLAGSNLGDARNSFVVAEWGDAGGPPGPPRYIAPRHLHHKDDEAWSGEGDQKNNFGTCGHGIDVIADGTLRVGWRRMLRVYKRTAYS